MADHNQLNSNTKVCPFTFSLEAIPANFPAAQERIRSYLNDFPCTMRALLELDMIVEEIFINIASYAYQNNEGPVFIDLFLEKGSGILNLTFRDKGTPYNPLLKPAPDVSSPAEKRAIGGLGIFLVQKYSSSMDYQYENGENCLTICKKMD